MAGQLTINRAPIRPTNSDNPLLRSAFAAGEPSTDREGDAELLQGLFGDEVEIGEVEEDEDQDVDDNILAEQDMPNGPMSESPEAREATVLPSLARPSAEAIEKHKATHLHYRSWCPVCVKANGKEDAHRRKKKGKDEKDRGNALPKISLDYQELKSRAKKGPTKDDKVVKIIVAMDESTGCKLSYRVESKGIQDAWIVKRLVRDFEELGRRDIILKTDGEPAMLALQRAIAQERPGITKPENPPSYNPASNGACEKAVQDVSGHVRALKFALEANIETPIAEDHPIMEWIITHAAFCLTHFSVGHDGMTPIERLTGRKWTRPLAEMGEIVMAKLAPRKIERGKQKNPEEQTSAEINQGYLGWTNCTHW